MSDISMQIQNIITYVTVWFDDPNAIWNGVDHTIREMYQIEYDKTGISMYLKLSGTKETIKNQIEQYRKNLLFPYHGTNIAKINNKKLVVMSQILHMYHNTRKELNLHSDFMGDCCLMPQIITIYVSSDNPDGITNNCYKSIVIKPDIVKKCIQLQVCRITEGDYGSIIKHNNSIVFCKYNSKQSHHVIKRANRIMTLNNNIYRDIRNNFFPNDFFTCIMINANGVEADYQRIKDFIANQIFDKRQCHVNGSDQYINNLKNELGTYMFECLKEKMHSWSNYMNACKESIYIVTFTFNKHLAVKFNIVFNDICTLYEIQDTDQYICGF